jgi:hypothetical protein
MNGHHCFQIGPVLDHTWSMHAVGKVTARFSAYFIVTLPTALSCITISEILQSLSVTDTPAQFIIARFYRHITGKSAILFRRSVFCSCRVDGSVYIFDNISKFMNEQEQ